MAALHVFVLAAMLLAGVFAAVFVLLLALPLMTEFMEWWHGVVQRWLKRRRENR